MRKSEQLTELKIEEDKRLRSSLYNIKKVRICVCCLSITKYLFKHVAGSLVSHFCSYQPHIDVLLS